jgi:hypothetical protein
MPDLQPGHNLIRMPAKARHSGTRKKRETRNLALQISSMTSGFRIQRGAPVRSDGGT